MRDEMQLYFIASDSDRPDLDKAITARFGENSRRVSSCQWLISADMTPKDTLDAIGASSGNFGKVIILLVTSYFGWHDKDMWDWIVLKRAAG